MDDTPVSAVLPRPVSAVNAVSLMLRQKEGQRSTADDRCRGAVETLRDVALAYHPVPQIGIRKCFFQHPIRNLLKGSPGVWVWNFA